jgi:polysaccharide biosynthesis transport protein
VEPSNLLTVARRWWWTILLAVVLAAAAGYASSSAVPTTHESRVRLLVGPVSGDNDTLRAAGQLSRTYAELATSEAVLGAAVAALGWSDQEDVAGQVRPTADSATRILIIRVRDADPNRAVKMANELAGRLITLTSGGEAGQVKVVDRATEGVPVGVPTVVVMLFAGFAGLVASLTFMLLLENLSERIRTETELVELSGARFLGTVTPTPRMAGGAGRGPSVVTAPNSSRAADHRMLTTKIELLARRDEVHSVLVLGVDGARSAGEVAANMAVVLAERRHRVTLVDADAHDRQVTGIFGLAEEAGLADLLGQIERTGDPEADPGAFTSRPDPRLAIVPAGLLDGAIAPQASMAPRIVERFRRQADFLVVNATPAHRSAATLVWAGAVDATILVVPRNRVDRGDFSHLIESLRLVGARTIGVVLEERRALAWSGRPASWGSPTNQRGLVLAPVSDGATRTSSVRGEPDVVDEREELRGW